MFKSIVIAAFVLCFTLAIVAYFAKTKVAVEEQMRVKDTDSSRATMRDFIAYRYEGHQLVARLSAQNGSFAEPNQVLLRGDVKGWRLRENREETMAAAIVTAHLKMNGAKDLFNNPTVRKVELRDDVVVGVGTEDLFTDTADYLAEDQFVVSDHPVRIQGPNRWLTGNAGFKYDLKSEEVKLGGIVKGMIIPQNQD